MTGRQQTREECIAVVGATGYVGGRLIAELLRKGYRVRAIARSLEKLRCRTFASSKDLEIAEADALSEHDLIKALQGCSIAYYLVPSGASSEIHSTENDRRMAANMAHAAYVSGLSRIIYLSRFGYTQKKNLSGELSEQIEMGEILASGAVPLTWLRTAMILGSGSSSFEILRYLVERLPVMLTPQWTRVKFQPVAISDVVTYLTRCLENQKTIGLTFEIRGPDTVSCQDIFDIYSKERGLAKRIKVPIPARARNLSAYGINLVTPVPFYLALPFVNSLCEGVGGKGSSLQEIIPIQQTPMRETIRRALQKFEQQQIETCWSDAGELRPPEWLTCGDAEFAGGGIFECNYKVVLNCPPSRVWNVLRKAGGITGWFFSNALWNIRGFTDRLLGGAGISRGRRHCDEIRTGDALDFWRVLLAEEDKRLVLLAEMKVPGEAVLNFSLHPADSDGCELLQSARFLPRGLAGMCYWYAMAPFHDFLFKGMLQRIADHSRCQVRSGPERFVGAHEICRLPNNWGNRE